MDETKISTQSDIQTSQAQNGGWSLSEGQSSGGKNVTHEFGSESAPTGVSTKEALANPLKTSQMLKGEFSLPES